MIRIRTLAAAVALTMLASACGTGDATDSGTSEDAGSLAAEACDLEPVARVLRAGQLLASSAGVRP